jgi:formylglycine-generating enzyme required for sulfatase activity
VIAINPFKGYFVKKIFKIQIALILFMLWEVSQAHSQEIAHVQFTLDSQNKEVHITYDFYDSQDRAEDVLIQASNDQGKTWDIQPSPQSLQGDLHGVRPGKGKSITWKAGDDFQAFSAELFQVRLLLVQVVASASSASTLLDPTAEATKEAGAEEKENQLELDQTKNLPQSITGKDGAAMVLIPAGYFRMGSPKDKGEKDEKPAHQVWVSSFYMDQTLVTFDRYDKFCDATGWPKPLDGFVLYNKPSPHWGRGSHPVLNLTWKAADAYCKWAGGRLPTEAEWEKAVRGGTESTYFWGNDGGQASQYAWYEGNSYYKTWPVGQLKPNPFGLYDAVGDLWEWVSDWYSADYYVSSPGRNPTGPVEGKSKVLRGGSFANGDDCLQSAHRSNWDPEKEDGQELMGHLHEHGCRCVQEAVQ